MFMMAHKDDCAIVLRGPTEEVVSVGVADGKGGFNDLVRVYPTACSCGGILVDVTHKVYVPSDQSPATSAFLESPSCSHE